MKRTLLALVATGLLSCPVMNAAVPSEIEHGNRTFYGFFLSNQNDFTNAVYPAYGFAKQTLDAPDLNELLYGFDGKIGVYAATCVEGVYYACPYSFSSSMEEPSPMKVMTYDIAAGRVDYLGAWYNEEDQAKPSDMTYDIKNDRILAICYSTMSGSGIYEMNRNTGAMKRICDARGGVIAADGQGRVFTIDHDGWLYQINLSNGKATPVFDTKCSSMMSNQTMEFDHTTGNLYWASCTMSDMTSGEEKGDKGRGAYLRCIYLPQLPAGQNFTASTKGIEMGTYGEIGMGARFQGLYIPYADGGFDAPAAVTDLTVTPSATADGADFSFKLPTTTFGGDPLTDLNGFVILRDGEQAYYNATSVMPGDLVTWSDRIKDHKGEVRYDIIVYNSKGNGPKSPSVVYVGPDRPAAVSSPKVEVAADFGSTTVTWTAPDKGYHNGAYDSKSVSYDVVRLPDNWTVAENIKDTKVTDTFFRRMLRYSYKVIAKNAEGSTEAETEEFIAGPVKEVPVTEDFVNQNSFLNAWMDYDNNGDGLTWLYATSLGHAVFGDYEQCAEYIVSPTSIDSNTKDADEWLISPPVKFEKDKEYEFVITARSFDEETVNIYVGSDNTVKSMQKVNTFKVNPIGQDPNTGSMAFGTFVTDLTPALTKQEKVACVGLQLATFLGELPNHYFQITKMEIREKGTGSVSTIYDAETPVTVSGRSILAPAGSMVFDLTGRRVNASSLPAGIYVVRTPSRTVKVSVR